MGNQINNISGNARVGDIKQNNHKSNKTQPKWWRRHLGGIATSIIGGFILVMILVIYPAPEILTWLTDFANMIFA